MERWRSEQASASTALIRNLAAGLGLVLVVGAAFALLGTRELPDGSATNGGESAEPGDPGGESDAPAEEQDPTPEAPIVPEETEPEEPEDTRISPESITVQVLDGYQQDGGDAAGAVTAELRELGYQVVAENPAIAYEITTVLWTEGNEDAARQLAEDIGATEVREQPGNLSAQVTVHVVVGADRAS
ncbi:MAG: LytR C-terminal domain-containing protein [Nitriliruptoraceae bacterium]